ncbi:stage II sporulation protein E SpoIIE [Nitzschia inconspicua]|uniref:Protein phosphatase n=1 Tax=Nitzschia inconspicua TaxID=303405 RepID=A0A9K3LYI9_9STRA|nr:stage II sporulation protein E SpoIIE [Nitzschia inconspicua]
MGSSSSSFSWRRLLFLWGLFRFINPTLLWTVHASATVASEATVKEEKTADDVVTSVPSSSYSSSSSSSSSTYRFLHKTVIIPHDAKKFRGGEDAAATTDQLLVVADGVGGWANRGVNPGLYSRLLTKTIVELFEQENRDSNNKNKKKNDNNTPLQNDDFLVNIVDKANHHAAEQHLGSATCTVVQLVGPNQLKTLNIGDSGYSIHRRRLPQTDDDEHHDDDNSASPLPPLDVVFASIPGQKQFNFPHQIGGKYGDVVSDVADQKTHALQPGDILVVYSDGVSDNLYPQDYHDCIDRYSHPVRNESPPSNKQQHGMFEIVSHSLVADCIARQAYFLGKDKSCDSPFAQGARNVGKRYIGGKHDDITVTVAQVVVEQQQEEGETAGPSSAPTTVLAEDPHYTESIYIYTGPIPSKEDLPTLEQVLAKTVAVGGSFGNNDEL